MCADHAFLLKYSLKIITLCVEKADFSDYQKGTEAHYEKTNTDGVNGFIDTNLYCNTGRCLLRVL